MAKPVGRIDMDRDQLDLLIADIARRAPAILPVLRAVRDGACGYVEVTYARSRVLRLGPPGKLPVVTLIADGEGRGPGAFRQSFLQHLFARAGAVVMVVGEQPDDMPYTVAAAHATEARRHVVVIETHRQAIEPWAEFSYAGGVERDNLVTFISDPSLPDESLGLMEVEDIPAMPRGPVH